MLEAFLGQLLKWEKVMTYRRAGYSRYSGSRYGNSSRGYHGMPMGYHHYGCSLYRASGGGALGFVTIVLTAIVATPLVGGYYLVCGKDSTQKALGGIALVVGIILWLAIGLG